MEITQLSPAESDVRLAELMNQRDEQYRIIKNAEYGIENCGWRGQEYKEAKTREYTAQIEEAKQRIHELRVEMIPYEQAYDEQRWSRFYLVNNSNGHVHQDMACSTCFYDTQYLWLPDCSGMTEEEIVAEFGEKVCTVCYPTAPVTPGLVGRRDREAQEQKDAEKAAKLAAKLEKALLPDGSELKTHGYESNPKTLIAGQRLLLDQMNSLGWYGESHPQADNWKANIDLLAEAISRKTGEIKSEVLATAQAKADKKLKKERGYVTYETA